MSNQNSNAKKYHMENYTFIIPLNLIINIPTLKFVKK